MSSWNICLCSNLFSARRYSACYRKTYLDTSQPSHKTFDLQSIMPARYAGTLAAPSLWVHATRGSPWWLDVQKPETGLTRDQTQLAKNQSVHEMIPNDYSALFIWSTSIVIRGHSHQRNFLWSRWQLLLCRDRHYAERSLHFRSLLSPSWCLGNLVGKGEERF